VGNAADVVLFDPHARWLVHGAALASQGKHTPFLGYELTGQVRATIVAGRVAFER
jgi:dihydroorotase